MGLAQFKPPDRLKESLCNAGRSAVRDRIGLAERQELRSLFMHATLSQFFAAAVVHGDIDAAATPHAQCNNSCSDIPSHTRIPH